MSEITEMRYGMAWHGLKKTVHCLVDMIRGIDVNEVGG
jgi:hypothetical protein